MTFRDDLIPCIDAARQCVEDLGLRTEEVSIRFRVWSGGRPGLGTATDTDTLISPRPKVADPHPAWIAARGGTWETGDRRVTEISRALDEAALGAGLVPVNTEVFWIIGGDAYKLIGELGDRPFQWTAQVRRVKRGR